MRAFMVLKSPNRLVASLTLSGGSGTLRIGRKTSFGSPLASRSIQAASAFLASSSIDSGDASFASGTAPSTAASASVFLVNASEALSVPRPIVGPVLQHNLRNKDLYVVKGAALAINTPEKLLIARARPRKAVNNEPVANKL